MGTWITRIATSGLIYRLTGSALLLGGVIIAAFQLGILTSVQADAGTARGPP